MPRHPVIIPARHAQGLAAYRAGLSLREVIGTFEEINRMHEQVQPSENAIDEHDEIDNAGPSLIAGFADGLIDDIRNIARSPNLTRRGQSA
jgi:hypothetical protein